MHSYLDTVLVDVRFVGPYKNPEIYYVKKSFQLLFFKLKMHCSLLCEYVIIGQYEVPHYGNSSDILHCVMSEHSHISINSSIIVDLGSECILVTTLQV